MNWISGVRAKALCSWKEVPHLLYSLLRASRSDFGKFFRSSFRRPVSYKPTAEFLPCPLPFEWTQPQRPQGSRRREQRFCERRAREVLVNLQVCALNFIFLGGSPICPDSGCRGPLSDLQQAVVASLGERVCSFSRLVGDMSTGSGSKLDSVQGELASMEAVLDSLGSLVYGSAKQSTGASAQGSSTTVVPTVASRVAFPTELRGFDPTPFLPQPFRDAYLYPDSLVEGNFNVQPCAPLTSSQSELWHLLWKWDAVGRLTLTLDEDVPEGQSCNLFCVPKADDEIRQIIDRRPRNSIERPPPKDTPKMGHASSLVNLLVPPLGCIRGSLDDLRNFYHEFEVSRERALSTVVGPVWHARDFHGSQALADLRRRRPDLRISHSTKLRSCFGGLSMGDHWAPAIAQVSHEEVLRSQGAIRSEEHLQLGHPLPRAPLNHYAGVCIDDKLSLQVFDSVVPEGVSEDAPAGRDLEACAQADAAYHRVGLQTHPKKKVRRAKVFKVWGAHVDGDRAMVGMDRSKLAALCVVSARLAAKGVCTERLLQKIMGLWAFACQFRRPLFALFEAAYTVGHPEGKPNEPFRMPRMLRAELELASVLGWLATADLKAQVDPWLYGTDASPSGAGIVACHVGKNVAEELFRRSDSRGFYTRLLSPQGACLHSKGYSCEEPEWLLGQKDAEDDLSLDTVTSEFQPLFPKNEHHDRCDPDANECMYLLFVKACWRLHRPVRSEFRLDFLEIYSGTARLSASMLKAGFSVGPPIELPEWDMGDESLFRFLVSLCRAGRISLCWLGPPCTTFSLARHPKGRSVCAPWGLDVLDYDTAVGNFHMRLSLFIFVCQLSCGNEAIVETPWSAFSRKLPWWKACAAQGTELRVDQCRYGTPYLKPTGLLCSSAAFGPLGRRCRCKVPHERLEGALTSKAAAYPLPLCEEVARLALELAENKSKGVSARGTPPLESRTAAESEVRDCRAAQRFVSHLWSTQLAEALPWKTVRAYRFPRANHINVLESHVLKTLVQIVPMNSRVVVFQDSLVTLGSHAKGRSSSQALNRILRKSMAVQLAKNVFASGFHCPTWALRADDPSRTEGGAA